jgi:exodeoxyribonuclease V alpha subunit
VERLNRELQGLLNPGRGGAELALAAEEGTSEEPSRLRPGDRVMQVVNDYGKEAFNGDIGYVKRVDGETGEIVVGFDGRAVSYAADEWRELRLAYAATIHKSQGSEYPAVVIALHMKHYVMLRRNLLYTALTRARRLACVVGQRRALWRAVKNTTRGARQSALGRFLGAGEEGAKGE